MSQECGILPRPELGRAVLPRRRNRSSRGPLFAEPNVSCWATTQWRAWEAKRGSNILEPENRSCINHRDAERRLNCPDKQILLRNPFHPCPSVTSVVKISSQECSIRMYCSAEKSVSSLRSLRSFVAITSWSWKEFSRPVYAPL